MGRIGAFSPLSGDRLLIVSRRLRLVSETRLWLFLAAAGFILRLGFAYVSEGSNDIITWGMFAQSADQTSVNSLYETFQTIPDSVFNHPPLMGYLGLVAWRVAQALALPFAFVFKLPMILADGLTAVLLWRIWRKERGTSAAALTVAAFGWSWLAILVAAYHGNTDSLGAFFCLLAAYLLQEKRPVWGGLALAAALNVKLIPIALVIAFVLRCQSWREVFRLGVGLALGLLPFLSVVACCGRLFYQNAIVYNSSPNLWGIVYWLMASQSNPALAALAQSWLDVYLSYARYLILELVALTGVWARSRGWTYYDLGAVSIALFLIFTPGFGVQYLVWLCPLLFATSLRWATLYSYLGGLFIGLIYYTHWDGTLPYRSLFDQYYPMPTPLIGILVWALLIQFVVSRLTRLHISSVTASKPTTM